MTERVLNGRYRVVRHIARGGMAEVYLAHDQLLDRRVAVKVLFPELAEDGSFVERFRREARAAAGLNHPNIVSVYDFGDDDGSYYIVMEYVEGTTLRDVIRSDGPLEPARGAEVGADIAAALSVAHQHGIIHRDVKPGNVLIASANAAVKVADFGVARAGDPRERLTMTGAVMGTATYLSPEQAQGHAIDHRSDIYALGVVLYETVAGRPPFTGDTPIAVAYKHLSDVPVPPSTHNPDIPAAFDAVVLRAMEKDPDARYPSADALRTDLLAVARGAGELDATVVAAAVAAPGAVSSTQVMPPITEVATAVGAGAPPPAPPADDVRRRRRLAVGLAVLLLLVVVLVVLLARDRGGTATVPAVVGLTVDDARARLDAADLRSAVEESNRPGPPGRVLEQRPSADARVDRRTTVTLVVPATTVATSAPRTTPTTRRAPSTTEAPATTSPRPTATSPPTTRAPTTTSPRVTTPTTTTTEGG